jgi:hypothetical protein
MGYTPMLSTGYGGIRKRSLQPNKRTIRAKRQLGLNAKHYRTGKNGDRKRNPGSPGAGKENHGESGRRHDINYDKSPILAEKDDDQRFAHFIDKENLPGGGRTQADGVHEEINDEEDDEAGDTDEGFDKEGDRKMSDEDIRLVKKLIEKNLYYGFIMDYCDFNGFGYSFY